MGRMTPTFWSTAAHALLMMVAGVTALGTDAPEVQAGIAGVVVLAILAGFVGLRTSLPLGPLDRIRKLSIRSRSSRMLSNAKTMRSTSCTRQPIGW